MANWRSWLPAWSQHYRREWLSGDLIAGLVVTVMLVPQSLAYALLAGLPAQVGLYASVLPLIAYALFGTSMTMAVGPVAVAALMTANALSPLAAAGSEPYVAMAAMLALLSGVMLLVFGVLRLGFLAHLLSHPVISGFISGSAVLIALGQLKHLLGVKFAAQGALQTLIQLGKTIGLANPITLAIGVTAVVVLVFAKQALAPLLRRFGLAAGRAEVLARLAPMLVVVVATWVVSHWQMAKQYGVSVVGAVPQGLPSLGLPAVSWSQLQMLLLPALLISLVGFVESVSVAQSLALKRKQKIVPDKELLGIGAANLASAISGGMPVTGGFARSVVNFSAGANTPLAGVVSALLMAMVIGSMTGSFYHLPHAVLAATIVVAVVGLIDLTMLRTTWRYDKGDASALIASFFGVVLFGVEEGILIGIAMSLVVMVWRSSHPHIAVVGRVPGTEHFRNVARFQVQTQPGLLAMRIDESLFFANASALEHRIEHQLAQSHQVRHLLLILSAVNSIDTTALEVLTDLRESLVQRGIHLALAEVKGPVMDRLKNTKLGEQMRGDVYLSTHDAFVALGEHAAS
jgi:sulfate permease, SulP family